MLLSLEPLPACEVSLASSTTVRLSLSKPHPPHLPFGFHLRLIQPPCEPRIHPASHCEPRSAAGSNTGRYAAAPLAPIATIPLSLAKPPSVSHPLQPFDSTVLLSYALLLVISSAARNLQRINNQMPGQARHDS